MLSLFLIQLLQLGRMMAQKVQILFEDDIDGSEAEGTTQFALDGVSYEIDLNETHSTELRKALGPFVDAARVTVTQRATRGPRKATRAPRSGPSTTEVREWAKAQGIEVKDRGRIPAELETKFLAAQSAT